MTVLMPCNVTTPLPEALAPIAPEVWRALRRELEARGLELKTVDRLAARRLWRESIAEAREASPRAGFAEAARRFDAKLARFSDYDAIVSPSLFVQSAAVVSSRARWDGADEPIELEGAEEWKGVLGDETPFRGNLPALSLHVAVIEAGGELRHQKQSGLVLLSGVRVHGRPDLEPPRFEVVPREDPLADPAPLRAGIVRALAPYFAAPADDPSPDAGTGR